MVILLQIGHCFLLLYYFCDAHSVREYLCSQLKLWNELLDFRFLLVPQVWVAITKTGLFHLFYCKLTQYWSEGETLRAKLCMLFYHVTRFLLLLLLLLASDPCLLMHFGLLPPLGAPNMPIFPMLFESVSSKVFPLPDLPNIPSFNRICSFSSSLSLTLILEISSLSSRFSLRNDA